MRMSRSATPATQNHTTTCFDIVNQDSFCHFPYRTARPEENLHSVLYTLRILHSALQTSYPHTTHSALYTLHFTLHIPHYTLYTLHFTPHILHFTLHILHFPLYTSHSTLQIFHSTLYTLHSALHNPHSTLYILHSPLNIPHHSTFFALHTLHSTAFHISTIDNALIRA